jgi:hypothetical protein
MLEDYREQERQRTNRMRSIMDYAMGALLIAIGACFLLYDQLKLRLILKREHSALDYVIGALFVIYGFWRIYRGYKKNYNR